MRKIIFIFAIVLLAGSSCKKDKEIGSPIDIIPDYVLPQGDASDAANDRIQEVYDTYSTYILYNYTAKDAFWTQSTGNPGYDLYVVTLGDVQLVDEMLDYIDDIWLKFLPEDFLKKGGLPYRVFLADELYRDRNDYLTHYNYMINGNAVIISGMNENLASMTSAEKRARKTELFAAMWTYYINQGLLDIPAAFYEGTDYTTPFTPLYPINRDLIRKRGFIPARYVYGNIEEVPEYGMSSARDNDLRAYMMHIRDFTDAEMDTYGYLTNPEYDLIRNKWNTLVDYYLDTYDIDLRAMANEIYE